MPLELSPSDLTALMASRICHDLISPVGAITNGLELLEEDDNSDMHDFAMDLVKKSALQASVKVTFARMAFGASGSIGHDLDLGEAGDLAQKYMANEKAELYWRLPRVMEKKPKVKLILNLLLIAINCLPRGGSIIIDQNEEGQYYLLCEHARIRFPESSVRLIEGEVTLDELDGHSIQPFYVGVLARECNSTIEFTQNDTVIMILIV